MIDVESIAKPFHAVAAASDSQGHATDLSITKLQIDLQTDVVIDKNTHELAEQRVNRALQDRRLRS